MFNEMAELENLEAKEVSIVPQGANRKKFIIRKEDGDLTMNEKELINDILENEFEDEERVEEVTKESKLSEKSTSAVKAAVRLLQTIKEKLPNGFMSKLSELAGLSKAGHKDDNEKKEKEKMSKENIEKDTKESVEKEADKKGDTKISKEDLDKVSPEIKEKLEAIFKSNEQLIKVSETKGKEIEKLSEIVKEEKNARILKEFNEEAQNEYSHLAVSDDLGIVLKEMSEKLSKESYEKITNILKEAEVITKKSEVFKEYGTSHSQGEKTLRVKIEKAKDAIKKSDPKLTDAQAEAKAYENDNSLYTEYLAEEDK